MTDIFSFIESFASTSCLLVGDVMLDKFIYGDTGRMSPEAPVPVLSVSSQNIMLGGAGNVARNIASLGAQLHMIALSGAGESAAQLDTLIDEHDTISATLIRDDARRTTIKTRYIAGTQQLLRVDEEQTHAASEAQQEQIIALCNKMLPKHDCLILSDYAKGTLPPPLIPRLIALANDADKPVLIDPKQWDISLYARATLLCPNEKEAILLHGSAFKDDADMAQKVQRWCKEYNIATILITRGAKGMMVVQADKIEHIPTRTREVYDVSGAGDTVLATLACAMSRGANASQAAMLANHAASIAVGKLGTATIYRTDLKAALHTADIVTGRNKIFSLDSAAELVRSWQERGLSVGFTNGCFDIVHAGHITSLSHCKQHCDKLVLAINSDESVARLKGPSRPVNSEMDRAMLLAALEDIDAVIIFREDTPIHVLEVLRPDVLMKGEDYQRHDIVGWDIVESYGGCVKRIPLVDGYSTTNIITKIHTG